MRRFELYFNNVMSLRVWSFITGIICVSLLSSQWLRAQPGIEYCSPVSGSTLVSPQSNIIIRYGPMLDPINATEPERFSVHGSASGLVSGRIILSDDGKTLIFLPSRSFLPGEIVSVSVKGGIRFRSGGQSDSLNLIFTISPKTAEEKARLDQKALELYLHSPILSTLVPNPGAGSPVLFKQSDDSLPRSLPVPLVKVFDRPVPGSIFLNPWKIVLFNNGLNYVPSDSQYLLILDSLSHPAFYRPTSAPTFDFKVLANGTSIYFDDHSVQYIVLDNSYTPIDSFTCGNGYTTDPHDIRLLANGHYVLVGLDPEVVDMSVVVPNGNPLATVIGFVIQELDLQKNVVFEWRSFDHFQITDATHEDLTAATIDFAHPNALAIDADSTILLSDRHMDEITKIDRTTGSIIWRWGGKNNQFTFINDTLGFSHQHSINRIANGHYTLFDNGNFHTPQYSRALEYVLDQQMKTATLVWQYRHTPDVFTFAMGSVERLSNGNTFIGWGASNLAATEVRPDGSTAYEIQFPDSIISYRAFKYEANAVSSVSNSPQIPTGYVLAQNYPNPFNPSTKIDFAIPQRSLITLKVYDVIGKEVRTLVHGVYEAGHYTVPFEAGSLASGMYLYRMTATSPTGTDGHLFTDVKRLMLIK